MILAEAFDGVGEVRSRIVQTDNRGIASICRSDPLEHANNVSAPHPMSQHPRIKRIIRRFIAAIEYIRIAGFEAFKLHVIYGKHLPKLLRFGVYVVVFFLWLQEAVEFFTNQY